MTVEHTCAAVAAALAGAAILIFKVIERADKRADHERRMRRADFLDEEDDYARRQAEEAEKDRDFGKDW